MRSVLMTLVAAFALLAFTGTQVYAAPRGGHSASKHHASHAKKGGKKKGDRKKGERKGRDRREHEMRR